MKPTLLVWLTGSSFVIAIDRSLTRAALKSSSKSVPGTYGAELADRMLCCVLCGLTDLPAEYSAYYRWEYPSVADFLVLKYGVPSELATRFAAQVTSGRVIGYGDTCNGGDYMAAQWIESEVGGRALRKLLKCTDKEERQNREDQE